MKKKAIFIRALLLFSTALTINAEESERPPYPKSIFSVDLGIGVSNNFYDANTANWLGNHACFDGEFRFYIFDFYIGGLYRLASIKTASSIFLNGTFVGSNRDVNVISSNYVVGYSFMPLFLGIISVLIDIEPYIGISMPEFIEFSPDRLTSTEYYGNIGGIIGGTIYFKLPLNYVTMARVGLEYNFIYTDLQNLNSTLGKIIHNVGISMTLNTRFL